MLGTVDRQGSLLGVDSLLSKLFEGDDSSFYARMAAHGDDIMPTTTSPIATRRRWGARRSRLRC